MGRGLKSLPLVAFLATLLPTITLAQDASASDQLLAGAFAGYGSGPSPTGVYGLSVGWSPRPRLSLHLERSRWHHGLAVCDDEIPSPCDGDGAAYLAKVRLSEGGGRVGAYAEAGGGAYDYSGIATHGGRQAGGGVKGVLTAQVGATGMVSHGFGVTLGVRLLKAFPDGVNRDVVGAGLSYVVGLIGVEYRADL